MNVQKLEIDNLINDRGTTLPNQFVIKDDKGNKYFKSYQSWIAKVCANGDIKVGPNWDYSQTTRRAFYTFMRDIGCSRFGNRKGVLDGINRGVIKLVKTIK